MKLKIFQSKCLCLQYSRKDVTISNVIVASYYALCDNYDAINDNDIMLADVEQEMLLLMKLLEQRYSSFCNNNGLIATSSIQK